MAIGFGSISKAAVSGLMSKTGIHIATEAVESAMSINSDMKHGSSFMGALGKEAMHTAAFTVAPWLTTAATLSPIIYSGVKGAHDFRKRRGEEIFDQRYNARNGVVGGGYMDTQRAVTMRQAAVQQIQGNKLNARTALGGEARIFSQRYG